MSEVVAALARPGWRRWRCDVADDEPNRPPGVANDGARPSAGGLGSGHRSVELRDSNHGGALLAAVKAQARLDGHTGAVAVHRARLTVGGRCEVRLGWAGITLAGLIARRGLATEREPDPMLPVVDLLTIGASIAATLADAHRLRPPLVHAALDASTIRLDRWGRARLDGFGARLAGLQAAVPEDDVYGLLVTLGDALRLTPRRDAAARAGRRHPATGERRPPRSQPNDPATAMVTALLASFQRRRPDVIDAGDLGRALSAMTAQYANAAQDLRATAGPPVKAPLRVHAGKGRHDRTLIDSAPMQRTRQQHHAVDDAASAEHDTDHTLGLGPPVQPRRCGSFPDWLGPLRRLGQGGHGEVWLAHDPLLDRNVVIKEFSPAPASSPQRAATTFQKPMERELIALAELAGHPASIECYGTVGGERPALVLSWCSEGPLDPQRRWSPTELAQLGAQVADALAVLHGRGLVHGDIKPHNLLQDRWGSVRLADFSLTSPSGSPAPLECSPRHAPPEQLDGGPLRPGADLAALAATLFHLAEGRPPLERDDGTDALVARRRAGEIETPPASLRALPGLSDWVMGWLQPNPDRRPSGGATVAAATLRALYRPNGGVEPSDLGPLTDPSKHHPKDRGRPWVLAIAVVMIVAVGALAFGGPGPGASRAESAAGARTIAVASDLDPPDPLSARRPPGLSLERGSAGTLVLTRTGAPAPDVPWVLRRDDFEKSGGIANDRPSASGPAGRNGAIGGPGPMVRAGSERSAVLAGTSGASCVRVVTSRLPPEVSAPLCWG